MGNAVNRYIVVGRPDPTGSKDVVVALGKPRHLLADELDFVLNRRDLLHFDTEPAQLGAEKMRVDVLGLAGQDFVADDDNAGGF